MSEGKENRKFELTGIITGCLLLFISYCTYPEVNEIGKYKLISELSFNFGLMIILSTIILSLFLNVICVNKTTKKSLENKQVLNHE